MQRFEIHAHTDYSNARLLDSVNTVKGLINKARKIGLAGVSITDHEILSGLPEANFIAEEIQKEDPNFKVALGNEIYLCDTREMGQKYYHLILLSKNITGWRALRELSSRAWMNSFWDRGMERVVTLKSDLEEIMQKYPGSLIATTACLGGELSTAVSNMLDAEAVFDATTRTYEYNHIIEFMQWGMNVFGDDWYIECAPGASRDQVRVNKKLINIAEAFSVKMVIGSDAHYLDKKDRYVHKAYLNSKGGEREVDSFYEYSYLQNDEEVRENLSKSYTPEVINWMYENSLEIYNKIENYSVRHKQTIPKIEVPYYEKSNTLMYEKDKYPTLDAMTQSDDNVERYWVIECLRQLKRLGKDNDVYLSRLEEEADIKKTISAKLETNMFAYPVTLQHYIDLFWECGSMVGAGRGSSCSGLNHYLLGVTQLDPIEWNLPFWRYLNKERVELGSLQLILPSCKKRV